jgi:chromosome segregation ATPase
MSRGQYRNFCEYYSSILPHHQTLKGNCKKLFNAIQEIKDRRNEKRKEVFRLNLQQFLKDVITKLNEKLELLKMTSRDLAKEFTEYQFQLKSLENENIVQQSQVDLLKQKLENVEKFTNAQVHKTRQMFMKSYKNLMNAKFQFESMERELDERCKEQIKIQEEVSVKNNQLKQTLCIMKKLRDANEPTTIEICKFDDLRNAHESLSLELAHLNSTINCMQDGIHRLQCESELIREVFQSKMRIIQEYDEWSREGLLKHKNLLESNISDQSQQSSGDLKIRKLQQKILLIQNQIDKSEECMDQLVKALDEIQVWKRPCLYFSTKSLLPSLYKKSPVIAIDYMGSTYVHLE